MAKFIEFSGEAHRDLERGMSTLVDAVKAILGPRGYNVVLEKKWGVSIITNDGVPIAKEIKLDDPYEKTGTELVKEVTKKTDDVAGDGTTTTTVVAQAMVREGPRSVTADASPTALEKGVEAAVATIAEELSGLAIDVETEEQITAIVSISAADPSVGEITTEAIDKVGKKGVITVEESDTFGSELELTEGMRSDKGYTSPYFVTDTERMETTLDDPYVLIVNSKILSLKDLSSVLERVVQSGKPLLVVAEDVEDEALAGPIANGSRGTFESTTVKAPGFGNRHKTMLDDIAILTGGRMIVEEVGLPLETAILDLLSRTRQVVVTKDECTIVDGSSVQAQIEGRVAQIRREIENSDPDYDREKLQERPAKLVGGVAVIEVGAVTEAELKERKHRTENAARNVRAAVKEGIVPDGGIALLQASKAVEAEGLDDNETVSANIAFTTAQAPLCQIAMNVGLEDGVVAERVAGLPKDHGLDAAAGEYVDMVAVGIIDPTKVARSTLQNAAFIAALFLATEAVIADKLGKTPTAAGVLGMNEIGDMGDP